MNDKKKLAFSLCVLFLLNILIICFAQWLPSATAATYREGSRGEMVKTIQTKLVRWGYLSGSADGIFGPKTREAVKYFQRKNGLTADGIVGAKTLEKLGIADKPASTNTAGNMSNDLYLLSRLISAESRGEPYSGQVAVGAVVMNRIKHPSFPNTLSSVIYQQGAFTALVDGQWNAEITDSARIAAQEAMNGSDPTGGAIYYYNPVTATNQWIRSRPVVLRIGRHVFCK